MSDVERDMIEQQLNDHWNKISKLLTDLGCDISMLIGLKTDRNLSEHHKKRL